jgi:spore germination protein GerM
MLSGVLLLALVVGGVFHLAWEKRQTLPVSVDVKQPFYAVYFGSPDGDGLIPEFRQGEGTIDERVASLLEGPRLSGSVGVLPKDVRFLGYSQRDGTLFLNFSHHLITNHPGGSSSEILTVYGIVNTLSGVQGVQKVQILVENRLITTLAGHLDLREPLSKDYELIGSSHL